MLMALLYCDDDRIAAAAPACDQIPFGDWYWEKTFRSPRGQHCRHGLPTTALLTRCFVAHYPQLGRYMIAQVLVVMDQGQLSL